MTIVDTIAPSLVRAVVPSVWTALYRYLVGKEICLYGPPGAGKTSLINFMMLGAFANPEEAYDRTKRDITRRSLTFKLLGNEDVEATVRFLSDGPGESFGEIAGTNFVEEKPHHCILVLDAESGFDGSPVSVAPYVKEFFSQIARERQPIVRTERIWVVLNKGDAVDPRVMASLLKRTRALISEKVEGAVHPALVRVRPCSFVQGDKWDLLRRALFGEVLVDVWMS